MLSLFRVWLVLAVFASQSLNGATTYLVQSNKEGIYSTNLPKEWRNNRVFVKGENVLYEAYTDTLKKQIIFYGEANKSYYLSNTIDSHEVLRSPNFKTRVIKEENVFKYKFPNTANKDHWFTRILTATESFSTELGIGTFADSKIKNAVFVYCYNFGKKAKVKISCKNAEQVYELSEEGDKHLRFDYLANAEDNTLRITDVSGSRVGIFSIQVNTLNKGINTAIPFDKARYELKRDSLKGLLDKLPSAKQYFVLDGKGRFRLFNKAIGSDSITLFSVDSNAISYAPLINFTKVQPNQANYIVVCDTNRFRSYTELVDLLKRQHPELSFATIQPQDIYNNYSFGNQSAEAIKKYLLACHPKYVVLIGDACNKSNSENNIIPTFTYIQLKPGTDDNRNNITDTDYPFCFADAVDKPVFAIGRIPIKNNEELQDYNTKLKMFFDNNHNTKQVIFDDYAMVAKDSIHSKNIIHKQPKSPHYNFLDEAFGFLFGDNKVPRLINRTNPHWFEYVGHANILGWSNVYKTRLYHMQHFKKGRVFITYEICCVTGRFSNASEEGFSENIFRLKQKGPITSIVATGFTKSNTAEAITKFLAENKFFYSTGELLNKMKVQLFKQNILNVDDLMIYNIFGLPSIN